MSGGVRRHISVPRKFVSRDRGKRYLTSDVVEVGIQVSVCHSQTMRINYKPYTTEYYNGRTYLLSENLPYLKNVQRFKVCVGFYYIN